jgi:AcrR family transcriptional regulator
MTSTSPPAGLRERKKAKTRAAIREQAMRLFEEQGYAATTIDQIAAAADVSPSTFFRYYPTKEDVVITDDYDPPMLAAIRAQPPEVHPIEALRRGIRAVMDAVSEQEWAQERRRQALLMSVPELKARALQQVTDTITLVADVVAERAGLPAGDFSARVLSGAVIGACLAALPTGRVAYDIDDFDRLDDALRLLEAGLPLSGSEEPAGSPRR